MKQIFQCLSDNCIKSLRMMRKVEEMAIEDGFSGIDECAEQAPEALGIYLSLAETSQALGFGFPLPREVALHDEPLLED